MKEEENPLAKLNSTSLILEPVLWGSLAGVVVGSLFGGVDQIVLNRRRRRPTNNLSDLEVAN